MSDNPKVMFADDTPEMMTIRELEFFYAERRIDQPSPFTSQRFDVNVTDGDTAGEGSNGRYRIHFNKIDGLVIVAPGWIWMADRTFERPRPVPPAPKPKKV